jgi:polyhydroxyalkanoate synthase subunit PhaC
MANDILAIHSFSDIESTYEKYLQGLRILTEGAKAETGQTPKEVIWTKNKARLYHYEPLREKRFPVPILLIYALINRSYVLDLMPGNSLVEYLSQQGFDVYMLDWGTPGEEDSDLTFDTYLFDYIHRAVKKVLRHAHAEELTMLGFCMGGTMTAMYGTLFPDKPLRNLILLTAPIDFTPSTMGFYGLMTSEKYLNPDLLVEAFGNVPGELVDTGNRLTRPVANYIGTYVTMWDRIMHDKSMDSWLAMNKWVNDGVPFAGAAFKQWIRDFYQQNKLVKGEITLRGRRVDLSNITCPVLNIAGSKDHICTVPQAEATMRLISSQDKVFLIFDAGHIGLVAGSDARKNLWPRMRAWLELHSS